MVDINKLNGEIPFTYTYKLASSEDVPEKPTADDIFNMYKQGKYNRADTIMQKLFNGTEEDKEIAFKVLSKVAKEIEVFLKENNFPAPWVAPGNGVSLRIVCTEYGRNNPYENCKKALDLLGNNYLGIPITSRFSREQLDLFSNEYEIKLLLSDNKIKVVDSIIDVRRNLICIVSHNRSDQRAIQKLLGNCYAGTNISVSVK